MTELKITAANFENEVLRSDSPIPHRDNRCIVHFSDLPSSTVFFRLPTSSTHPLHFYADDQIQTELFFITQANPFAIRIPAFLK